MDAEASEAGHLSWEAETDQPQPLNDQHQPRSDQQQPLTNQPAVQQPQEQLTAPDYPSSLENLPEDGSSSRSRALLPLDYYQVDEPSIGPITAVNAADNQASLVPGLAAENARQLFGGQLPAGSQVPPYYFFLNPAFRESALQGRPVFALDGGPTTYGDVFTIPAARPTYAADYNQPAFKQNGGQQENPYQTAIEDYRSFARAQLAKSVIKLTVHPYPTNFYILKQCCGSKYIDFGSRILAQFGSGSRSGSRVMFLNLKEKLKIILEKNYQTSCHLEKCLVS